MCLCGGTGRRGRLKICCPLGRAGSIPARGTIFFLQGVMEISLTGDRPTGHLHLGHFVGSLLKRVSLQRDYRQYIMVADVQALTDYYHNPDLIVENVFNVVEDYLAVGLSPNDNTIFLQSRIPALSEMFLYFLNLVSISRVQRNPTVKTEIAQKNMGESVTAGFVCYPISQAADILAFKANVVPVGDDQLPMIEQTNEIVRKFNSTYVDLFVEVKAMLSGTTRLPGIDGKAKASKSLNNAIFLVDSEDVVKEKVMQMYTDPNHLKVSDHGCVEGNVVFEYLDAFYHEKEELEALKAHYRRGGLGDVVLKKMLIKTLHDVLEPIRARRANIKRDEIRDILAQGCQNANRVANSTLEEMRSAMRMIY